MRYIEVQQGIILDANCIEGIKQIDDKVCHIYTHHRRYESTYPYATLVAMLKEEDIISHSTSSMDSMRGTMEKLDAVLGKAQHFAG